MSDRQSVHCVIFPRPDATPGQLKRLGQVLDRWASQEEPSEWGMLSDHVAVTDLLAGEQPQPYALRHVRQPMQTLKEAREELGPDTATTRAFALTVLPASTDAPDRAPEERRNWAIRGLRHWIPADLVAEIRVEDESWDL